MPNFLDNTIYTNHALNKIGRNLVGNYENFNFLKIKIGSGDNTLSMDRTDVSTLLYTLKIKNVDYADGVVSIICEIPPELAEIPITEIGLFDTVLGVDYLFSYSKVEITKPSDLGYELTIVLNLGPRTIDFPGINMFYVPSEQYATKASLLNYSDMFTSVNTNLERVIASNAQAIGYNMAEVAYERQLTLDNILRDMTYANLLYSLYGKYGEDLKDLFFIHEPNYLSYDIVNLAEEDSYLNTYSKLFISHKDNITFHDGAVAFIWMCKMDDITKPSTILNKKDEEHLYFSIDTKQDYEIYKIETFDGSTPNYHRALYNELVITFYGVSGSYTIKYIFNDAQKGNYVGVQIPYILTFNGDFQNPVFKLYVNGEEIEEADIPTQFDSKEIQSQRKESDFYGKVMYGTETALLGMPDYSSACSLRNHLVDYNTGESYNYDNALNITAIMTLKKQVNKHDIAFLSSVLRSLGEMD